VAAISRLLDLADLRHRLGGQAFRDHQERYAAHPRPLADRRGHVLTIRQQSMPTVSAVALQRAFTAPPQVQIVSQSQRTPGL
jgi:hypothetical protein